ncbi:MULTISPECIES: dipeptidase PepE [Mesonia]|uniref:Peptidase E n=1 Tax=Mesonia oceanica TaxID=2687242 RepID=A0AC61Y9S0_9FLAO|nr:MULTISPECIES: dipeptidase PepE [Mesonia]MAN27871.1 dipeptidase PepE [Mesonia sp.]MAQ41050.1 dipeptidase PepE [Mesonia sp.]MBJ96410.1 dipeptidase PepE [Flavobacteriaceae bacterium]VVV01143.1 Peptidase E [Mesonia oceanica]|tara:strand:+ start:29561 stop:30265 length:705 start_codon:yes stop_codon:yes gene_type:complete
MNCIIASTSTVHGSNYLAYLKEALEELYKDVSEIIFIPYARPGGISHDEYTQKAKEGLAFLNKEVKGLHKFEDPAEALQSAQALFTGGGNTFLLVSQLYNQKVLTPLKKAIESGTPYLGTSAGSNICGLTMGTTNDMPIVYPPSFKTLGILEFNLNPHYLDPDPTSTHKGETRETRIKEFHHMNAMPVVGLREGSWLRVKNNDIILEGGLNARIFEKDEEPYEVENGTSLKDLE